MSKVAVIDLDGTLIRVNSFPLWMKSLLASAIARGDMGRVATLVWWSVLRRVGTFSHDDLKKRILALRVSEWEVERFVLGLLPYVREDIVERIRESGAEYHILATAAPATYGRVLSKRLGLKFDAVLCSSDEGGVYTGMAREDKLSAVIRHLDEQFPRGYGFSLYTDHEDDLPLAARAETTILCNASDRARAEFKSMGAPHEYLDSPLASQPRGLTPLDLSNTAAFEAACDELYDRASAAFGRPELLVGIATGGAVMAERMGARFTDEGRVLIVRRQRASTGRKSRVLGGVVRRLPTRLNWTLRRAESAFREWNFYHVQNDSPRPSRVVEEAPASVADPKTVLIVDDAVDTGETLEEVRHYVEREFPGAVVRSAVLATSFKAPGAKPDVVLHARAMLRGPWSLDA